MARRKKNQEPENRPAAGTTPEQSQQPKEAGAAPEGQKEPPEGYALPHYDWIIKADPETDPAAAEKEIRELLNKQKEQLPKFKGMLGSDRQFKIKSDLALFYSIRTRVWMLQISLDKASECLDLRKWDDVRDLIGFTTELSELLERIYSLSPYLTAELEKPEYNGATIDELLNEAETDDDGNPLESSLFRKALTAAQTARAAAGEKEIPAELSKIIYKKKNDIQLTIGKGSLKLFDPKIWKKYNRGQVPGQMSFIPVSYEKPGQEEITLYCGITENSFRSILTPEDYFYLSFIGDAYLAGNTRIAISKFYREMTGTRGNATQLKEVYNKLAELQATPLIINDREVRAAWHAGDEKATYREIRQTAAPITLGAERYIINGGISEAQIIINDFPAILKIDLDIGQYTTVPKTLLQIKRKGGRALKRTPRYHAVLQYLIHEIARIKSGNRKNKIIYTTFYNDIGETSKRGQQLALTMLYIMLDHFVSEGWLTGYKEETTKSTGDTGVRVYWDAGQKRVTDKKKSGKKTKKEK